MANIGAMRHIYLVGIMGSGKSFWGRRLADRLGFRFVDTDELIVARAGRSIPDIFAEEGESGFREREAALLRQGLPVEDCVIATGGGMPCFCDNMEYMLAHGVVVWLNPATDIIARRIWKNREKRPLIAHADSEVAVEQILQQLLEKRMPDYAKAHIVEKQELLNLELLIQQMASVGKFALG